MSERPGIEVFATDDSAKVPDAPVTAPKPRLRDVEARAAAATEGPWVRVVTADRRWNEVRSPSDDREQEGDERPVARSYCDNSADFIAASRTDVPALTAAIRAVLAHMDNVEAIGGQPILRYEAIREVLSQHIDLDES